MVSSSEGSPRCDAEIGALLDSIESHARRIRRDAADGCDGRESARAILSAVESLRAQLLLSTPTDSSDSSSSGSARERVLLVEDDAQVRQLLTRALERLGVDVEVARNGREAIEAIENGAPAPDILVTDVVMPELGGRELAVRMRLRDPDLKVLFVSGYSHGAIDARFLRRPGTAFLQKPFTPRELGRALSDLRSREAAQRA
ncbi:MAG: response regulator [Planctomycetota bacterium JB042]